MSMNQKITCREFITFLDDYFDGSLPSDRHTVFKQHLTRCAACVDYLESYQTTVQLVKKMDQDDNAPEDVPSDLVKAILATRHM